MNQVKVSQCRCINDGGWKERIFNFSFRCNQHRGKTLPKLHDWLTKMTSLMCDVHFWSLRDDHIFVRDTDFSSFKYYDKGQVKAQGERPYAFDKMTYANGRGLAWFIEQQPTTSGSGTSRRTSPNYKRLKTGLKELEELLAATDLAVVYTAWRSSSKFQLMFSNGCIVNIFLDKTANLEKITFDKAC